MLSLSKHGTILHCDIANNKTHLTDIQNILSPFSSITLDEMDSVKLLDRVDTKFTFNIRNLPSILSLVQPYYRVLEINGLKSSRYETLYFDTKDFRLYILHHNGKLNRYKVRYRSYIDTNQCFFEVKFKTNKGRTIKDRITRKEIPEEITGKAERLLSEKSPLVSSTLHPALWVYYSRVTLVNKSGGERLTIDLNLNYNNNKKEIGYPKLVIAEVKQGKTTHSPFIDVMRNKKISDVSISKYCYGIASIYDDVKKNRFKPKIRTLNKIML